MTENMPTTAPTDGRQRQAPQCLVELLSLYQALGQLDPAPPDPQGELHQEVLILLFAPEGEILTRRPVAEGVLPVERGHDRFDLARAQSARVQTSDHRAHAGPGNRVYRNVQLLEDLQHAYVRCPPRAPAG